MEDVRAVGHGKRLFEAEGDAAGLTLAHSQALGTGVVQLVYNAATTQGGAHYA